ncbi:light-harvesting antenna LH1, beta subunit [Rubrimonas cliftonensis]|uniref:Antenna pigment protein beta chain n=1 Tax=Rubrimonas cliftonensis TaxID=89524 RepID=A0A1H4D9U9_9RHOB|nr:light-harvesting antenna LH1, beta subunit [Rubrimonas cliftonensis]SEA69494.1 light-harvesting complex 1 beta chain [Rubrimonas cliftonensis]
MPEQNSVMNPNGISDDEAKEIHGYFVRGVQVWAAVAFIAHVLVWQWLPWFPG